jgi:hypothetical protein
MIKLAKAFADGRVGIDIARGIEKLMRKYKAA